MRGRSKTQAAQRAQEVSNLLPVMQLEEMLKAWSDEPLTEVLDGIASQLNQDTWAYVSKKKK